MLALLTIVIISIVIPWLGKYEDLEIVLNQLSIQTGQFEVIIVGRQGLDYHMPQPSHSNVKLVPTTCEGYEAFLNEGAAVAEGEILLFVDPQNQLPPQALAAIERNLKLLPQTIGGNFHLKFNGSSLLAKPLSKMLKRWRYRGSYYHGSGIFVRKDVYQSLNGFKTELIMPDFDFVQRMEKCGPTLYLPEFISLPMPHIRKVVLWLIGPILVRYPFAGPLLKLLRADVG